MARKKDCFASETYACRTSDCPYAEECVKAVWEKKVARLMKPGAKRPRLAPPPIRVDSVRRMRAG